MSKSDLFEPVTFNGLTLKNRIALSPLTRARATQDGHATDLQATYYAQRAGAGLLITEATAVVPGGRGGPFLPGLWQDSQIEGWKKVTDAAHAADGLIFSQLWHAGRLSHSSLSADGKSAPVSPSEYSQPGQIFTEAGPKPFEPVHVMSKAEIADMVESYRAAAERAKKAGFDGIELHAAHSYLISSFLNDMTNTRDDEYGGSIENRARFLKGILEACLKVWDGKRIMVRLAPLGHAYGTWDTDPEPLFAHVIDMMNDLGIGWLDLVEGDTGVTRTPEPYFDVLKLRKRFSGATILNNLYTRDLAIEAREKDSGDVIAFGRAFISNPDLPARLEQNAELTPPDLKTFYTRGPEGYIDYPALEDA
ncbi:MAG: alkene reductase [Henriciella sp.]